MERHGHQMTGRLVRRHYWRVRRFLDSSVPAMGSHQRSGVYTAWSANGKVQLAGGYTFQDVKTLGAGANVNVVGLPEKDQAVVAWCSDAGIFVAAPTHGVG